MLRRFNELMGIIYEKIKLKIISKPLMFQNFDSCIYYKLIFFYFDRCTSTTGTLKNAASSILKHFMYVNIYNIDIERIN